MAKSWEQVRRESPLNESRVAAYRRLTESEERISQARRRRGVSQAALEKALAGSQLTDGEFETEDEVYLTTLTRFVAALGGHVEIRAVFADETITVRREPEET